MTASARQGGAASLVEERAPHGAALLIVDMISSWRFPDAEKLLPGAAVIAPRIAALKARCRRAGTPVIYANDNQGRWRSDFRQAVDASLAEGGAVARLTGQLLPDHDDYFILKPRHSAFFATPLELLLQHLWVRLLVVAGVSSDQCIVASVADARMRDLQVVVPRDCIATQSAARNRRAIQHLDEVLCVRTPLSPGVRLKAGG